MRLFTKLRAEQISTVAYPLPAVTPADPVYPAETRSSSVVAKDAPIAGSKESYPQTVRATDGTTKVVNNNDERNAALGQPSAVERTNTYVDRDGRTIKNQERNAENDPMGQYPSGRPNQTTSTEPEAERVVITTIHRESYESPKSDLLLSPKVAERKGPEGPIVGDWYVTDYDIMTDKVIRKVYDNDTFQQYFKASIGG